MAVSLEYRSHKGKSADKSLKHRLDSDCKGKHLLGITVTDCSGRYCRVDRSTLFYVYGKMHSLSEVTKLKTTFPRLT